MTILEKAMAPHSSTLAWKIPWTQSLVGCSSWGHEESDMTEWLHFHSSLSCIGEGNGNPLQYSCLENPRDGGAWWAAVYGVARVGHGWSDLAAAAAMTILPYICNCKTGFVSVWKLLSYKWLSKLLRVPQPPPTITWGPWIRDPQYEG